MPVVEAPGRQWIRIRPPEWQLRRHIRRSRGLGQLTIPCRMKTESCSYAGSMRTQCQPTTWLALRTNQTQIGRINCGAVSEIAVLDVKRVRLDSARTAPSCRAGTFSSCSCVFRFDSGAQNGADLGQPFRSTRAHKTAHLGKQNGRSRLTKRTIWARLLAV